ncbi:MAG: hypothetical protein MJH11_13085, partial [Lentisphaeria bacterium]|nr:hypothetical protein [Lentisphaeria bacterium]
MPILTAEDHDNFIRNGVLILRGLVPKDICETATAKLDEVAVKGVKPGDDIGSHPEVKALITDKVKQVLDEILGDELKKEDYGNPFSLMTPPQENLKEVSLAPDATGLHVDDDDPTVTPTGWCLRLVIFPRKVIPGGGGFIYSPGSHIRYMTQLMQSPNDAKSREIAQTLASPICEFTCEAGDTVIMSSILA